MNRIKIGPQGTLTHPANKPAPREISKPSFELEQFANELVDQSPGYDDRAVFVPLHYEANYAYPLIVWLHDNGEDEHHLADRMFEISMRNYVGVAPRAPERDWDKGFCWPQTPRYIQHSFNATLNAIDEATGRFSINSERIYLAGHGAGGSMAFRLAFMRPDIFAGVISLNGQVPEDFSPLAQIKACRDLSIFWAHGRKSCEFSENRLCEQLRLLHVAGFSVTLRQYPCGDEMMPQAMRDINVWIMDAINGTDDLTSSVTSSE
jgi:phospholipase/carboxylesterase